MGWGLCAYAAYINNGDLAMLVALVIVTINLVWVSRTQRIDMMKSVTGFSLGFFFEFLNMHLGVFTYTEPMTIPPLWIVAFWPMMATLFFDSFKFLFSKSTVFCFLFGLLGGLSYYSGESIGRLHFKDPQILSVGIFSVVWALEFLLTIYCFKILERRNPSSTF